MKKFRIILMGIFIFSIFMIGLQVKDKRESEKINSDLSQIYYKEKDRGVDKDLSIEEDKLITDKSQVSPEKKELEKAPPILDEFKALVEKNKDTVGWLKIENTNIDYPVVKGSDNEFYLDHDFYGNSNQQGSIFMDFRNRIDLSDKHTIIYGHHMKNRTMFNDLNFFKDEEFFRENKIFKMKSLYDEYSYEIFSAHVYENDPYIIKTRFNNDEFSLFTDYLKEKSKYKVDTELEDRDKILTLITCSYDFNDARYIVHARRID